MVYSLKCEIDLYYTLLKVAVYGVIYVYEMNCACVMLIFVPWELITCEVKVPKNMPESTDPVRRDLRVSRLITLVDASDH